MSRVPAPLWSLVAILAGGTAAGLVNLALGPYTPANGFFFGYIIAAFVSVVMHRQAIARAARRFAGRGDPPPTG